MFSLSWELNAYDVFVRQKKKTAQEIQELVKGERNVPLVIDFYATWCGPCILMAQELEMVCVLFFVLNCLKHFSCGYF